MPIASRAYAAVDPSVTSDQTVNAHDALPRPADIKGAIDQSVLQAGRFLLTFDLLNCRLTDVDNGRPFMMPPKDFLGQGRPAAGHQIGVRHHRLSPRRSVVRSTGCGFGASRFGIGLSSARVGEPMRRDRLLLVGALVMALLTLPGTVAENLGMDRLLKFNTSKTRSRSLFRQA
jgi:hypothetical protein